MLVRKADIVARALCSSISGLDAPCTPANVWSPVQYSCERTANAGNASQATEQAGGHSKAQVTQACMLYSLVTHQHRHRSATVTPHQEPGWQPRAAAHAVWTGSVGWCGTPATPLPGSSLPSAACMPLRGRLLPRIAWQTRECRCPPQESPLVALDMGEVSPAQMASEACLQAPEQVEEAAVALHGLLTQQTGHWLPHPVVQPEHVPACSPLCINLATSSRLGVVGRQMCSRRALHGD